MEFKHKKLLSIPEQIAQYIKQTIVDGQIQSGEKLPSEQELADQFQVSRPTIRDALKILAASKLIYSKPGIKGGHYIAEISISNMVSDFSDFISISLGVQGMSIDEVVEIRQILEIKAAFLAAQRRTEEDLESMREILEGFNDLNTDPMIYEQDFKFHRCLARATKNRMIMITTDAIILSLTPLFQSIDCPKVLRDKLSIELQDIYEMIQNKEPEKAAKKMAEHIGHFGDFFTYELLAAHQNLK